jgi:phosphate transport system substrate-binding protein
MAPALRGAVLMLAALSLVLTAPPLWAQDVTLSSRDGAIELSGTLQAYDGEFYRVDTVYGMLTLAAEGVICTGPGCPDLTSFVAEFTLSGAHTLGARLMPALIADFAATQGMLLHVEAVEDERRFLLSDAGTHEPVARIALRLSSSDAGLMDLLAGEADIALSLSELRDETVQTRVVALDAFVPVVGRGNPLSRITLPQLAAVFSGEIDNWSELGWMEAPIALHARNANSGVQQALEAQILAPLGLPLVDRAQRHDDDVALRAAVAADPFAIGISLWSEADENGRVALHGACGIELSATPLTIKAADYPLTLPLLLHTRTGRLPLQVRRFLGHAMGPAAQTAIRDAGFVDQQPEAHGIERQAQRLINAIRAADQDGGLDELRRLVDAMEGAQRLSTTFRFESGATTLDVQSRGNVEALARDLEAGLHDGRELVFVGFTDGEGSAAANLHLSRAQAEAVREMVLAAAPLLEPDSVTLGAEGFGKAMPMACDDSDWGRRVNRRVEVWLL